MRLYTWQQCNGAVEPWNWAVERSVHVNLDWRSWLIGAAYYPSNGYDGHIFEADFGPLSLTIYWNT